MSVLFRNSIEKDGIKMSNIKVTYVQLNHTECSYYGNIYNRVSDSIILGLATHKWLGC